MKTLTGKIILPAKTPAVNAGQVFIEVRDPSLADVPSPLIVEERLKNVSLKPNGEIMFTLAVPEVEPERTLSLRVHISLDGSGQVKSGDLLTTASYPIPATETAAPLEVRVNVI